MSPPHPLENLSRPGGSLKPESPDAAEIAGLLRTGRARLADAGNTTLALESRFDLAYNAAHALCLAALRTTGYRAANRYIVFQLLPHTSGCINSIQNPRHEAGKTITDAIKQAAPRRPWPASWRRCTHRASRAAGRLPC